LLERTNELMNVWSSISSILLLEPWSDNLG
jgi:hypothetical protein